MMKSDKPVMAIALAMVAIILIGEAVVYTSGGDQYSASAQLADGRLDYSVSSKGSAVFTAAVMDNGGFEAPSSAYIYFDAGYAPNYEKVQVAVGARALDQEYYVRQLLSTLSYRGMADLEVVDAAALEKALSGDVAAGGRAKALICISGALPDTVYSGNAEDLIFQWMEAGGSLYWLGGLIGAKVSTPDGLRDPDAGPGYQKLFFGADCLNAGETDRALSVVGSNGYRDALSLSNNRVKYGVDASKLPAGTESLSMGFEEEGYSSITFVKYGRGMICVIGGDYSNYQKSDLAQVACARVCYSSKLVAVAEGTVHRGEVAGSEEIAEGGGRIAAYIYLGGYFPVYGRYFDLGTGP